MDLYDELIFECMNFEFSMQQALNSYLIWKIHIKYQYQKSLELDM